MENNIFTNKELYSYHFDISNRQRRLDDFLKIYDVLKNHLEPKSKARINEDKIKEYIQLYKEKNRDFIKRVLNAINHIDFNKFCSDTYEQLEKLNSNINSNDKKKKYVYILGVNDDVGSSHKDFNIYKSNLWMFMLIWDKLETKPYDILLNVKIAIRLYGDEVEYLIVDDCSYSGSQIVDHVLYSDASETLYKYPNSFLIMNDVYKKSLFKPVQKHNIKIHLFIPYLSYIAWSKINEIKLTTCFDITTYEKYILNEFGVVLSSDDNSKLYELYNDFYRDYNPSRLIPIFFDHKIADTLSTVELILIKGQVLDNNNLRLIFVEPCDKLYTDMPKQDLFRILYCPIPPYHSFKKILEEKL
jgi:hypothetical protein